MAVTFLMEIIKMMRVKIMMKVKKRKKITIINS